MKFRPELNETAFLLMGKSDFFYHMQGYGNHTMSIARKISLFDWHGSEKLEFLGSAFSVKWGVLKCVLVNSVIADPYTQYICTSSYLLFSYALSFQIPPLVSHTEPTKILAPWMTWSPVGCKYFIKIALKQFYFFLHTEKLLSVSCQMLEFSVVRNCSILFNF